MIAPITTLKLNKKMVLKNTEKVKNIARIRLCRWVFFTDGDGIPLAFNLFPGSQNEQTSLKPLEEKIITEFGCKKFIFCSDAGLGSENNRLLNHTKNRAYIVTQSIKKLSEEYRASALNKKGFQRISDDSLVDLDKLTEDDKNELFYK